MGGRVDVDGGGKSSVAVTTGAYTRVFRNGKRID
jgi:hypothetical protein